MEDHNLNSEQPDILEREDRCRKNLKTVSKAIFMRLAVSCLLIFIVVNTAMEVWVLGLMGMVLLINLAGVLPLFSEWKRQKAILRDIIAEDET